MYPIKSQREKGQALLSGIIFFLIASCASLFFLAINEKIYSVLDEHREEHSKIMSKMTAYANTFNEISLNNQLIVNSIAEVQRAAAIATEHGLLIAFTQPYWKTLKIRPDAKKESPYVEKETETNIKKIYETLSLLSGRHLYIARALSERNKFLIMNLPMNLKSLFKNSKPQNLFCMVLHMQRKYYSKPGFSKISLTPLYPFHLTLKKQAPCTVVHQRPSLWKVLNPKTPLVLDNTKDTLLDYESLATTFARHLRNINISYVPKANEKEFYHALTLETKNTAIPKKDSFHSISNFLIKLNLLNLNTFLTPDHLTTHHFFITHHNIYCGQFIAKCNISKIEFLRAFFEPKWSASELYTDQKGI